MRLRLALLVGMTMMVAGAAQAQTAAPAGTADYKMYVEGFAQSAFGNQTSQAYGGEAGLRVSKKLFVFIEGGKVRNAAPAALGTNAQVIAGYLAGVQTGTVNFTAKEPIGFGTVGIKYPIPTNSAFEPYVLGGLGVARVTNDVHFFVAGTDVTSALASPPFLVTLGSDLSGSTTRPMLVLGGGVAWPVWERLVLDFQFRYGRVFVADQGVNVSRAGIGIGVRF